ncbi:MAG: hypothetical protein ABF245_09040, partial [Planktotalea arctica]
KISEEIDHEEQTGHGSRATFVNRAAAAIDIIRQLNTSGKSLRPRLSACLRTACFILFDAPQGCTVNLSALAKKDPHIPDQAAFT